jgi:hypothetical protein
VKHQSSSRNINIIKGTPMHTNEKLSVLNDFTANARKQSQTLKVISRLFNLQLFKKYFFENSQENIFFAFHAHTFVGLSRAKLSPRRESLS